MLKSNIDKVYVKSIEIGGNLISDYESGFFTHPNKQVPFCNQSNYYIIYNFKFMLLQVDFVCNLIANDSKLKNGFNAIGFSQGGQFLYVIISIFLFFFFGSKIIRNIQESCCTTMSCASNEKSYISRWPTSRSIWFTQLSIVKQKNV